MLRNNIVELAQSFVGTKSNNNDVIFNTDYYNRHVKGASYAWCCTFVWDIFRMCNASEYFFDGKRCAGCTTLLNHYKAKYPQRVSINIHDCMPGDLVLYQFDSDLYADHIGIFKKRINDKQFIAIEGNTSTGSGSQTAGGVVAEKTRKISQVMAFVHIKYDDDNGNGFPVPERKLKKTWPRIQGEDIKWLQWQLCQAGIVLEIDGIFGPDTEKAVRCYQALNPPLEIDGIVGPLTLARLKEVL